jgi:tetratricopeptide (TPR) repeat protein
VKSYERIGNVLATQGKSEDAIKYFSDGLDLMAPLVAADPARLDWRRDLAVWRQRFSNLLLKTGDLPQAMVQIQHALKIGEALAKQDSGDARLQLDLAAYKESHAHLLFGQGDVQHGLSQMMDAHDITEWVASCDTNNTDWQHRLAISHANLGAAFGMAGEPKRMREHLQEGRSIMAALTLRQPDHLLWQRDLQSLNMQIARLNR